ncbi:unnamed protein product [Phytomonas sp. Hart1]|nr:unnamed protein product [Phytomonas sp. Hart1]|eukprot:CCW69814.1 unnamed protein product [Phytomonas sp. isolate Hart1]
MVIESKTETMDKAHTTNPAETEPRTRILLNGSLTLPILSFYSKFPWDGCLTMDEWDFHLDEPPGASAARVTRRVRIVVLQDIRDI